MTRGKAYMYQHLNEHPRLKGKNIQAQLCVIANIPAQSHTKMFYYTFMFNTGI